MDTVIYIIGPTAVGKTSLATFLARKLNGNLISADSIQVYKGLDIISGKDLDNNSHFDKKVEINGLSIGIHIIDGIPTWGLDIVEPTYSFHVSDFYNSTLEEIDQIRKKNNVPIVVGGTTLYVNSLLYQIDTIHIKSDQQLREQLEEKTLEEVQRYLKKLSPDLFNTLNKSELGNKRRIIRKIEIVTLGTKDVVSPKKIEQSPIIIGLVTKKELLRGRIDVRVEQRIENGAFEEADKLFKIYPRLSPQIKNANGYKQLFGFLNKEYSKDEAIMRWKFSEYRHAKNQMTYFKKYISAEWFDIEQKNYKEEIVNFVSERLS